MKTGIWSLIGFALFILGFVAIILSFIGAKLSFLAWMDSSSVLIGLIIKLLMIVGGAVIIVLARTDWEEENSEA